MPPIRIELLGKLRVTWGPQVLTSLNTHRLQSLLAFLVLQEDAPQSRERLAFLLWPESNEAQARTNLRQLLHHLRRALPVECSLLVTDNHTVRWRRDGSCSIDVVEFELAAMRALEAGKRGNLATARESLEAAARLYQDDLLPDLYDDWVQTRREQLRQQFGEVLSRLVGLLEMLGEYPAAIRYATRLVALDPLREISYQTLIRLHARNQDRSSALRVYHQCMRILKREFGVSPGKATQDLFTQVLKSESVTSLPVELPIHDAALPTPMVGRQEEWQRLLGCWRMAMQGKLHFGLIMGEPGIGKSRLAGELFQWVSRHPDATVARARCYYAQGQLAYAPVTEWLRVTPLRAARAELPKSQLSELSRVLPEILVENPEISPAQPFTEGWQRRHFHEALNAAFSKVSKPLLLLIDDLQWCDPDSIDWLHSFFREAHRILILGTVRQEELGRDHPLTRLTRELRQAGQLSELVIAALNIEETTALAAQVARRECDPQFLNALYRATKGNPLFVVESVRASLDEQSPKIATTPRVQAVISGRLAQLSPEAYELAGLAATIGRSFSIDLLAKATDWDEDSLHRALEELWQRRIIDTPGAEAYDYTHDLLREVAYSELSPIRRRLFHRRVARALEELYARDLESVSGWLATHFAAAGLADRAIGYYRAAAAVAKQRFADIEAADLLQRALALCSNFPESAKRDEQELDLLVTLGPSLVTTHGYGTPQVGEAYQRALLLSQRSGERKHFFSIISGAWVFHVVRGELHESKRAGLQCFEWVRDQGVPELKMASHFLLGCSLFHLGQLAASRDHMQQAIPAFGASDAALALFAGPDVGVSSRSYLSQLLCQLGHAGQAAAHSDEAIALARHLSHPFSLAIALDYAAMLNVFRQDAKAALVYADEALAVCRKYGFVYYLAWAEILAGWATALTGDPCGGLAGLRHGLEAFKATGAELRLPLYYGLLAEVHSLSRQTGEALANIASGFAFQSKNGELWCAPELHRIHGDVLSQSGNRLEAEASYRRAIESARQTGARLFELRAATRLSELRGR